MPAQSGLHVVWVPEISDFTVPLVMTWKIVPNAGIINKTSCYHHIVEFGTVLTCMAYCHCECCIALMCETLCGKNCEENLTLAIQAASPLGGEGSR